MGLTVPLVVEGWQTLPSGGRVWAQDKSRIIVTDEGRSRLDEWTILAESARLLNAKLEYAAPRAKRWRKAQWWVVFTKPKETWHWNTAEVLRAACEHCGEQAGRVWWPMPKVQPGWVCQDCYSKLAGGEPWD